MGKRFEQTLHKRRHGRPPNTWKVSSASHYGSGNGNHFTQRERPLTMPNVGKAGSNWNSCVIGGKENDRNTLENSSGVS